MGTPPIYATWYCDVTVVTTQFAGAFIKHKSESPTLFATAVQPTGKVKVYDCLSNPNPVGIEIIRNACGFWIFGPCGYSLAKVAGCSAPTFSLLPVTLIPFRPKSLLVDRFQLKFHRVTRTGKVYLLERKGEGVRLHPTKIMTTDESPSKQAGGSIGFAGSWVLSNTTCRN